MSIFPIHHQPAKPLKSAIAYWPFQIWALDFVGPISPSSKDHQYILTTIEYFTKWGEVVAIRPQNGKAVPQFLTDNIICRFGLPQKVVTDNSTPFVGAHNTKLLEKYNIERVVSSPYNPQYNGQVESFNKVLKQILRKKFATHKRDWHEKLLDALWAYRTSSRTSTVSLLTFVHETDVVLLVEVALPSFRLAVSCNLKPDHADYVHIRMLDLEILHEQRSKTALHLDH